MFHLLTLLSLAFNCQHLLINGPGNMIPLTAERDPSLPSIRLNGCTFHLETFGNPENPAILFLPGGLADYRPFLSFAKAYQGKRLQDNYFLILWDMRGKGLSERFDKPDISFKKYLEDIEAVVNHFCGDTPIHLIGHSFGGIFAAMFMNTHPDKIAGAVIMEPGAFKSEHVIKESDLDMSSEWINDLMWCQQFFGPSSHDYADLNFTLAKCQNIQPEMHTSELTPFWRVGVAAQHWLGGELYNSRFDFTQNLKHIKPEILFIAGSETERLGVEYTRQKLSYFQSARMEIIKGAGHGDLIWAKADTVVPVIMEYFETLNLKGGSE